MKKTLVTLSMAAAIIGMTGCVNKTPKPNEFVCKDGSIQDKTDPSKCMVTTGPLKGTVEKIDCEESDDPCVAYILDERGRTIKTKATDDMKVGSEVDIILYKSAEPNNKE